jgi:acyl-CoA thioester hydrolase
MSKTIPSRSEYAVFIPISTRWMDNDQYGHVNNVVYYSYFDTAVNQWLINNSLVGTNLQNSVVAHEQKQPVEVSSIGLVVQTQCEFHSSLSFPQALQIGLRLGRLGNTSVRYELAVFAAASDVAAAHGHFVHVYVDAITRRPVALPDKLKSELKKLATKTSYKS